ncbi:MAG: enoyl-CoA hydratase-related protein [Pseudomonadota bacterium]
MSGGHLRTARKDGVLTVTIDNPDRRNAIGTAALDWLDVLADEIAQDSEIRAVVLTGAGDKAFTSGFDLKELGDFKPENFLRSRFSDVFERWARLPVPVIGALNGHCMGGGVHVAVICDALISVPGVRFMIPAARFGFIYVPASIERIKAALGPSRAAQLLYLNQELTAEDLAPSGFVSRIVDPADLQNVAAEMAANAAVLSPLAVSGMKEILRESPSEDRVDEIVRKCAFSQDVVEGLNAMRGKRAPVFTGQ